MELPMADDPRVLPAVSQIAHVTTSLERATEDFGRLLGIREWLQIRDYDVVTRPGHRALMHLALAYKGDTMLEIIQPLGGDDRIYSEPLEGNGYIVRQHHIARFFENHAQFDHEINRLRAAGVQFPIDVGLNETEGRARVNYADLRSQLGYYVENLLLSPGDDTWLTTIPRN